MESIGGVSAPFDTFLTPGRNGFGDTFRGTNKSTDLEIVSADARRWSNGAQMTLGKKEENQKASGVPKVLKNIQRKTKTVFEFCNLQSEISATKVEEPGKGHLQHRLQKLKPGRTRNSPRCNLGHYLPPAQRFSQKPKNWRGS